MMKTNKFAEIMLRLIATTTACVLVVALIAISVLGVQAETTSDWMTEVADALDAHEHDNISVMYATDSVVSSGVRGELIIDVLSKQVCLNIIADLPFGYIIYDDPSTDYIDGIRLNGNTVTSYKVPIDYTQDIDYEIAVRTVYAEGVAGSLAQMSDGTYDWTKLLENPIGLLMALYYAISTISVVGGMIALAVSKRKKAKSSNEIYEAVERKAHETATAIIHDEVLPVVTSFQNTAQSLVKAFALTTSKSKEAPSALLDVLQSVSNTDATAAIEQAKVLIEKNRLNEATARNELIEKLHNIANTSQEAISNESPEQSEIVTPSIF